MPLSLEERQEKIAHLRKKYKRELATPLASEGSISPYQVSLFSKKQREKWQQDAQTKIRVLSEIRELSKSDEELKQEEDKYTRQKNAMEILRLENHNAWLEKVGVSKKTNKILPKYRRTIDANILKIKQLREQLFA